MNNDAGNQDNTKWEGGMEWMGLPALARAGDLVWQCEATRAGRLYSRTLFDTREEAEEFVKRMRDAEPDQMFNVEAIKSSTVWN